MLLLSFYRHRSPGFDARHFFYYDYYPFCLRYHRHWLGLCCVPEQAEMKYSLFFCPISTAHFVCFANNNQINTQTDFHFFLLSCFIIKIISMGPNVHSHAHTHTPTHLRHHSIEFIVMYESHAEWSNQLQTKSKPLKNYHEFQAHTKKGEMRNKKETGL